MNTSIIFNYKRLVFIAAFILCALSVFAKTETPKEPVAQNSDSIYIHNKIGAIFDKYNRRPKSKHFTWGADLGSSVDLTGHDFTTFDATLCFGYKNSIFNIAGISVGIRRAIGTGNTFVPLCAIVRTNFRKRPSLLFFNFTTGYSFNTIKDSKRMGGFVLSAGLGINLSQNNICRSHIIIGYGFYHINDQQVTNLNMDINHVDLAQIGLGIEF